MGAVRKKTEQMDAQQIADRLLRELQPRFVKLVKATGHTDEDGQVRLYIGSHKHGCEACFDPSVGYERILRSFMGWAEQFARKLGVTKLYANIKDEDGDDE